jgi:hypothetical protein
MRILFSLSPVFLQTPEYESSIKDMVKSLDISAAFAGEASADALAARLADCDFAFFDLTGLDPDVMFSIGLASQFDDVMKLYLFDPVEDEKIRGAVPRGPMSQSLLKEARAFHGASDFQRKARIYISEIAGAQVLNDQTFVAKIKEHIEKRGPIYMRQLARDVGRPMTDLQPVVYDLVRKGQVRKIGDRRWTQYAI